MPTAETRHYMIAITEHCEKKTSFGQEVDNMAKKSDFRQKLLDDLRLRREQLAMAQSSQYQGQNSAPNAHESFHRSSHGLRERNFSMPNGHGNRPNSTTQKSSRPGHHRSPAAEQSLQEIMLSEKPGRSSNSSDLSMALAFAIENGEKFINMGSPSNSERKVISHHLQRSFDFGEMSSTGYVSDKYQYSTNQFCSSSYMQIREISRGSQKLNQILKSCSNEINFDRDRSDVGKELLKGAIDLEESFRMFVNLQTASDYKVSPCRKPVRLAEEGEEEEEVAENRFFKQYLLALSSYSTLNLNMSMVDSLQPSQSQSPDLVSSYGLIRFDLDSKVAVLNPGTKGKNFGSKELPASKNGNKTKQLDSRNSEQDKGRLPNVIAKLMGLKELPLKSDSRKSGIQKGPSSKHGAENDKNLNKVNRKDVDLITRTWERPNSQIATTDNPIPKAQKNMKNGDVMVSHTQKPPLKFDLQRKVNMTRRPVAVDAKHETEERNGSRYQKEKENENDVVTRPRNTQRPVLEVESLKPYMVQKSGGRDTKHDKVEKDHSPKNMKQPKITTSDTMIRKNPLKLMADIYQQKKLLQVNQNAHPDQKNKHDSPASLQLTIEKSPSESLKEKRASPRYLNMDTDKVAATIPPIVIMKPLQIPSAEKLGANEVIIQQQEKPIKIESRSRKVGSPHAMGRPSKLQNSVFQEVNTRRDERTSKKTEASISKSPMQKKANPSSTSCDPVKDDHKILEEDQNVAPVSNASSPYPSRTQLQSLDMDMGTSSKVSAAMRLPEVPLEKDTSLKSNFHAIKPKESTDSAIIRNSHLLQPDSCAIKSNSEEKERPTEHGNHLKHILIKSPHFLNAAEALFKLHSPVDILHASNPTRKARDSKLVLDCAYETMRRKARRKKLNFHPLTKMATVSVEVKTLDELVKELDEDLDQLKFHSCGGGHDQDAADCLYRMLQTDIQSRNPDINCMWDIGWKCKMFAEHENEVVREVEKLIFDGLINEIIRYILRA